MAENTSRLSDAELIKALGGSTKVAELLGYDKASGGVQRVQNWISRGIPASVKLQHFDLFVRGAILSNGSAGDAQSSPGFEFSALRQYSGADQIEQTEAQMLNADRMKLSTRQVALLNDLAQGSIVRSNGAKVESYLLPLGARKVIATGNSLTLEEFADLRGKVDAITPFWRGLSAPAKTWRIPSNLRGQAQDLVQDLICIEIEGREMPVQESPQPERDRQAYPVN